MTESGGKTEGKADTKSEATESSTSDGASSDASDGIKSDPSSGYSRGENQKVVTEAYRSNWDDVFGKKKRRRTGK